MNFASILLVLLFGQVKDATTHEPLIGATVLVEHASLQEVDLTHAWTDGWTSFDPQNEKY